MSRMRRFMPLWLSILLLSVKLLGQVQTGTPPFGSFSGGPDIVNNANLSVHNSIRVIGKAGRGMPFTYTLSYDSAVWYPVGVSPSQTWVAVTNWGWRDVTEAATGYVHYNQGQGACGTWPNLIHYNVYSSWTYYDPFGTAHTISTAVSDVSLH